MKSRYTFILICFSAVLLASCGNRNSNSGSGSGSSAPAPAASNARISTSGKMHTTGIVFVTEMHNFGTLKAGEIVSFSFIFTNNGAMPFRIKKAETSCGCISVKYDKKEIAPGKSAALEVILNTSGEWGNQLKMIEVETSSGEKKELKIGAYIENEQFNNLLNTQK